MIKRMGLIAILILNISNTAHAGGDPGDVLTSSFAGLTTVTETPGTLKSKSRTTISAGRFNAYAKTTRLQVFDFSPPSMSAGCGGVSMHFGGLSFANGEQYKQLVSSIIQNSPGLLIQLAITTACEPCGTAFKDIQKITNLARQAATDSCEAAKYLIGTVVNNTDLCKGAAGLFAKAGGDEDISASTDRCKSEYDGYDLVKEAENLNSEGEQEEEKPDNLCRGTGLRLWCSLSAIGLTPSAKAANDAGTNVFIPIGYDQLVDDQVMRRVFAELLYYELPAVKISQNPNSIKSEPIKAGEKGAGGRLFAKAFMCGTSQGSAPSNLTNEHMKLRKIILKERCGSHWDGIKTNHISMLTEEQEDTGGVARLESPEFTKVTIKEYLEKRSFPIDGMLTKILDTLFEAASNTANKQNMSNEALAIIQNTPLPIIQLINLSYAFPVAANEAIGKSAEVIAMVVTKTNILDAMRVATKDLSVERIGLEDQKAIRDGISHFVMGVEGATETKDIGRTRTEITTLTTSLQKLLTQEISKSTLNSNLKFQKNHLIKSSTGTGTEP